MHLGSRHHWRAALIILLLLAQGPAEALAAPPPAPWLSYENALALGARQPRPVLIYFNAPWCFFCKKMERLVFSDRALMDRLTKDLLLVWVDVSKSPRLAELHQVTYIPTMLLMDQHGKPVLRLSGYVSPTRLAKAAAYLLGGHHLRQDFPSFEQKD